MTGNEVAAALVELGCLLGDGYLLFAW